MLLVVVVCSLPGRTPTVGYKNGKIYFKYKMDVTVNGAICTPPLEHMLGKVRPINAERDAILLFLKHLSSNCIIISMYSFCYCFHLQYLLQVLKAISKIALKLSYLYNRGDFFFQRSS